MPDKTDDKRGSEQRRAEQARRKNLLLGWEFKEQRDGQRRTGKRREGEDENDPQESVQQDSAADEE